MPRFYYSTQPFISSFQSVVTKLAHFMHAVTTQSIHKQENDQQVFCTLKRWSATSWWVESLEYLLPMSIIVYCCHFEHVVQAIMLLLDVVQFKFCQITRSGDARCVLTKTLSMYNNVAHCIVVSWEITEFIMDHIIISTTFKLQNIGQLTTSKSVDSPFAKNM